MDRESKYVYPETDVLINRLGIQDAGELERAERIISTRQLAYLKLSPKTHFISMIRLRVYSFFM